MKRLPFCPELFAKVRRGEKDVTRRLKGKSSSPRYKPGEVVIAVTRWAVSDQYDDLSPLQLPEDVEMWIGDNRNGERVNSHTELITFGKARPGRYLPLALEHHFPRVRIVSAREENVQDIDDQEAIREGIEELTKDGIVKKYCTHSMGISWQDMPRNPLDAFHILWNQIHKKPGERWEDRPAVLRYEFRLEES